MPIIPAWNILSWMHTSQGFILSFVFLKSTKVFKITGSLNYSGSSAYTALLRSWQFSRNKWNVFNILKKSRNSWGGGGRGGNEDNTLSIIFSSALKSNFHPGLMKLDVYCYHSATVLAFFFFFSMNFCIFSGVNIKKMLKRSSIWKT